MSYSYQWERRDAAGANPVDIVGETGATYVLQAADVGHTIGVRVSDGTTTKESTPTAVVSGGSSVYQGARIDGQFYQNKGYAPPSTADAPWSSSTVGGSWDLYEAHSGKKASVIHYGGPGAGLPGVSGRPSFDTSAILRTYSRNAFPLYSLACSTQEMLDLAASTNVRGALSAIDAIGTAIAATGKALLIRPPWEMNADWGSPFPWQVSAGVSSANYVAAWRTIVTRIRAITNLASFVWCPNVMNGSNAHDPTAWWPGGTYVDWVALDGYLQSTTVYSSPASIFDPTWTVIAGLSGAAGKPLAICETGCAAPTGSPGKAAWITDFLTSYLPGKPEIKLFAWFNETGDPEWPQIEVGDAAATLGGAVQAAYHGGIADARYLGSVAGSFPAGAPVPIPA